MSWAEKKLDELGFVGRGKSRHRPRNDPSLYGGEYPFIQTADIKAADLKIQGFSQTYNEEGLAQSKLWTRVTLCMTIAGENTAETAILDFPACFPDSIVGFIPDPEKAEIRFIKYSLDQMKRQFRKVSKGATQDNLSLAKLLSFSLSIPDLAEQKRIVGMVGAYDDLIENNRRRIVLLEEAARLLYREWFVHFRFPGAEHVKIVDGVPEGWERTNLGEVAEIKKGKNITKSTVKPGSVPVVAGGLTPAYFHDTANTKSPVITVSASGANAGFVNLYHQDVWASDCSYIESNDNSEVFYFYLLLKNIQAEIFGMQKGSAQPHVYPKDLRRLEIAFPPKQVRDEFLEYVSPQFKLVQTIKSQNEQLTKARDLLLPRLMDGRLEI